MRVTRVLIAAALLVGVALATASPAAARPVEEPMYGIYAYHQDGAPDEQWTIYATCVQAGCVLHVSSIISKSLGPDSDSPGYGGDARKVNGLWTWQLKKDKGLRCPDGGWAPATYQYQWDQASLAGTLTVLTTETCASSPGATKYPFTLTFKEPLPVPIILDPLNQIENLW